MQETIKRIMEAEKTSAQIIADAQKKASEIINANSMEISDNLNKFRENEQIRFNTAIEEAENQHKEALSLIKTSAATVKLDIESVSDEVVQRVMKTIFD